MLLVLTKLNKYLFKNPVYNALVHLLVGVGMGILMTYPIVGVHPLRFGFGFLVIGVLGYLYPFILK